MFNELSPFYLKIVGSLLDIELSRPPIIVAIAKARNIYVFAPHIRCYNGDESVKLVWGMVPLATKIPLLQNILPALVLLDASKTVAQCCEKQGGVLKQML